MAIKKPITDNSGILSEILSTDQIPVSNLGSGTANATTYLRGDGTWQTPAGGGSVTVPGADRNVIFNNNGSLGADANFYYYGNGTIQLTNPSERAAIMMTGLGTTYSIQAGATAMIFGVSGVANYLFMDYDGHWYPNTPNQDSGISARPWRNGYYSNNIYINSIPVLTNITGKITAGTGITLSGAGTTASPYSISSTGGGGGTTINNTINSRKIDQSPSATPYGSITGSINGSNTVFTVSNGSYQSGTLSVTLNGQRQTIGTGNDFSETSSTSGTFTFTIAPPTGAIVQVEYAIPSSTTGNIPVNNIVTVTSNYTISSTDSVILADATSGPITINLPAASSLPKIIFYVKKIDSTSNAVTIDPNGSELIDGVTTKPITSMMTTYPFISNGLNWYIL